MQPLKRASKWEDKWPDPARKHEIQQLSHFYHSVGKHIKSSHCCVLRKTEGRPVLGTSEIQGAQQMISTKKPKIF